MNGELTRFNIALLLSLYHKPLEFHLNMRCACPCCSTGSCSQASINCTRKPVGFTGQHHVGTAANGWAPTRRCLAPCRLLPPGLAPCPSVTHLSPTRQGVRWQHRHNGLVQAHCQSGTCGLAEVCPARASVPSMKSSYRNKPQKSTGWDSALKMRLCAAWWPVPWPNTCPLRMLWWINTTMPRDHLNPFLTTFTSPRQHISSFSDIWG